MMMAASDVCGIAMQAQTAAAAARAKDLAEKNERFIRLDLKKETKNVTVLPTTKNVSFDHANDNR